MITNQRDTMMNEIFLSMQSSSSSSATITKTKKNVPKNKKKSKQHIEQLKSCPLIQALLEYGVKPEFFDNNNEEYIEKCKLNLQTWGVESCKTPDEKIFKYAITVFQQKMSYQKTDALTTQQQKGYHNIHRTNASVIKQGSKKFVDWSSLKRINICDLQLFDTCWGCCLEGVVASEAILPMIGGTVLVQDSHGQYVLVTFYNFLAEGIRGVQAEPILAKLFPLNAKICIAEPFTKIFGDGSRGIRVDNRNDIHVDTGSSTTATGMTKKNGIDKTECNNNDSTALLDERKTHGNELFTSKQYNAAVDVYIDALNSTEFIPTVLSNRCQAYICQKQWYPALLDSAASLTIRPNSTKTWDRYNFCIKNIKENIITMKENQNDNDANNNENRYIFKNLIPYLKPPNGDYKENMTVVDTDSAEMYKAKGNEAFKNKSYNDAILHYSDALVQAGTTIRTILNNWAQCSIEIDSLNDIIASTCAAIRISVDDKSIYRLCKGLSFLGEYELVLLVLDTFPNTSQLFDKLRTEAKNSMSFLSSSTSSTTSNIPTKINLNRFGIATTPVSSRWVGLVEPFVTATKGRGLRACADLEPGQLIIVDRALAKAESDVTSMVMSSSGNVFDCASTTKLKAALVHRCHIDCVLSNIVSHLADGTKVKPLVPLRSLMRTLNSCHIVLPGLYSYFNNKHSNLTTENIHNIVSINIHGGSPSKQGKGSGGKGGTSSSSSRSSPLEGESNLYPLIATMNHSNKPNCMIVSTSDDTVAAVVTIQTITKGSEICLQYTDDESLAAKKWKF